MTLARLFVQPLAHSLKKNRLMSNVYFVASEGPQTGRTGSSPRRGAPGMEAMSRRVGAADNGCVMEPRIYLQNGAVMAARYFAAAVPGKKMMHAPSIGYGSGRQTPDGRWGFIEESRKNGRPPSSVTAGDLSVFCSQR